MISAIISRVSILLFGMLYPAYASYKAVRTKNVKEYVKWMMYWIVFAFFTFIETFTDIFLSWFPFYYEIKVLIVIWLLSPATKGSSTLYRKFVHPMLTRREQEIDEYINQAKEKGYTAVLQLGSKGVNYATNVIMQTALKGGGNLVQTIRRSYSLSDLSEPDDQRTQDEIDEVGRPQRLLRTKNQTMRSSSGGRNVDMYFSEVDVGPKAPQPNFNYMRSSDDISSGYSSAEPVSTGLSRTASLTNATRPRFKAKRAEDEVYLENEEYEELSKASNPSQINSSYAFDPNFAIQYHNIMSAKPPSLSTRSKHDQSIADLKSQVFFDNEKYFQDLLLDSLINNKQPDNSTIDHESKVQENPNRSGMTKVIEEEPSELSGTQSTVNSDKDNSKDNFECSLKTGKGSAAQYVSHEPPLMLPGMLASKFELFQKWLADSEKLESEMHTTDQPIEKDSLQSQIDDEFRDTVTGSDDDIFHDIQSVNTQDDSASIEQEVVMVNEEIAQLSVEQCKTTLLATKRTNLESVDSFELPSILSDFNSSRKSSITEIKRPVTHQKGKAPDPPTNVSSSDINYEISANSYPDTADNLSNSATSRVHKTEERKSSNTSAEPPPPPPESVLMLNTNKVDPKMDNQQQSRSPSPRLESKSPKTGKISLFKSYLPSLFRPESPKPHPVSNDEDNNDYPKETQI